MRTAERTFYSLCEEIDYWKEQALFYKNRYEQEVRERNRELNERLESSKKALCNAISFALSVQDDEKGNLVIQKADRKRLAENLKN